MVQIVNVSKTYVSGVRRRRVPALQGLSLAVAPGEVFGFLGPNGAGKSTTIKVLLGLIKPDSGSASIGGLDVARPETRRNIGYLPENPYFYDYLSASELLWFGARTSGLSDSQAQKRIPELLDQVGLTQAAGRPLRTYSKGMVQRAGLAFALVHNPDVVVLDEPMSGLDPLGRKLVVDIILDLKARGKTVFFSSHILSDAERLCDRAGIIVSGKLRCCGSMNELLTDYETLEGLFIAQCELFGSKEST